MKTVLLAVFGLVLLPPFAAAETRIAGPGLEKAWRALSEQEKVSLFTCMSNPSFACDRAQGKILQTLKVETLRKNSTATSRQIADIIRTDEAVRMMREQERKAPNFLKRALTPEKFSREDACHRETDDKASFDRCMGRAEHVSSDNAFACGIPQDDSSYYKVVDHQCDLVSGGSERVARDFYPKIPAYDGQADDGTSGTGQPVGNGSYSSGPAYGSGADGMPDGPRHDSGISGQ